MAGLPDAEWGEVVDRLGRAGRRGRDRPAAEELTGFAADRLARFKCPRRFVFVDALPRNALGKVLRHELSPRLTGERGGPYRPERRSGKSGGRPALSRNCDRGAPHLPSCRSCERSGTATGSGREGGGAALIREPGDLTAGRGRP